MDLENASANMLFKPIEHFSAAKLEYQRVTLENAFSCALGTPKNILLTLFDQTLVVSDLSQEDVQPSYGVELSFDLKFEIIYAEEVLLSLI